jgi:hypothetical protein
MQTDNEYTSTDLGLKGSKAWWNRLPTKLGLQIFEARAGGAYRVMAHKTSAALACTSGESLLSEGKEDTYRRAELLHNHL